MESRTVNTTAELEKELGMKESEIGRASCRERV